MNSDAGHRYPRVLVLTQNRIQPYTGGGVVLSNLFGAFPANSLFFLHRDIDYDFDTPYVEQRLRASWLRCHPLRFLNYLGRWVFFCIRRPRDFNPGDITRLFSRACHFHFPGSIHKKIKAFAPDILYAWVGDTLWAETVKATANRYDLPYVIHFMDNHIGAEANTAFDKSVYPGFQHVMAEVTSRARSLYTISDSMGRAYQALWQRPYEVFRGSIDTEKWPWPNSHGSNRDNVFRIAFTGSIESGQLIGLEDVARVIDQLLTKDRNLRLVLYLTEGYAKRVGPVLGRYKCVEIRPHPDFEDLREELASVDALILAYGLDTTTIDYYRYSFATKIVPYMLSGRPILVYGPDKIAPVQYALQGGWALSATSSGADNIDEEIAARICHMMDQPLSMEEVAKSAWNAGKKEHDQKENALRFQASLMAKSL